MFDMQVCPFYFPCSVPAHNGDSSRPSINHIHLPQGKFKRNKWQEFLDAGVSKDDAAKKYVEKYNELKEKHGLKA
jgi:acyl-CoA-binding protein